jgi:hypothetical protein
MCINETCDQAGSTPACPDNVKLEVLASTHFLYLAKAKLSSNSNSIIGRFDHHIARRRYGVNSPFAMTRLKSQALTRRFF